MYKVKYDNYILYKHIDQLQFCSEMDATFRYEGSYITELTENPSHQQVNFEVTPEPQHPQIKP